MSSEQTTNASDPTWLKAPIVPGIPEHSAVADTPPWATFTTV
ncbi:hypothetical protein [Streptomyces sp. Ac-502]